MALFEKHGLDPWRRPHMGVAETCEAGGVTWDRFALELENLAVPGRDTDWTALPAYHLLDFLRAEHREFAQVYLPALRYALDSIGPRAAGELCLLRDLVRLWPEFASVLSEHMREEDEFLFPKILRQDCALRGGEVDPDFNQGSVRKFLSTQLLRNERDLHADMDRIAETLRTAPGNGKFPDGWADSLLREFIARLRAHSRLESEVLGPMAVELERKLYDRGISGAGGPARKATSAP
jgi:iron-sulfur cluster repair protein YtfE (RIC family)